MSFVISKEILLSDRIKDEVKILMVTGSSGGHIFPAISLSHALKSKYGEIKIIMIIPSTDMNYRLMLNETNVCFITVEKFNLSIDSKNFFAMIEFFKGILKGIKILVEFKPDIVVGFGGIYSVPVLLCAWIFRMKTLIHEQNVIPGRANRLLAYFVDRIAISFEKTEYYLKQHLKKVVFTGNPAHSESKKPRREEALNFFDFVDNKFTILVMGGSQGSHAINRIFFDAPHLFSDLPRIQIIHLTGARDYNWINEVYKGSGLKFKTFAFLKEMHYAYSISDLAICRAGATTITELIRFRLPAIIIPYPHAYNHQSSNAQVLLEYGCAKVIDERSLSLYKLKQNIEYLMNNSNEIKSMQAGFLKFRQIESDELLMDGALSLLI